jgi:hypothetical protein
MTRRRKPKYTRPGKFKLAPVRGWDMHEVRLFVEMAAERFGFLVTPTVLAWEHAIDSRCIEFSCVDRSLRIWFQPKWGSMRKWRHLVHCLAHLANVSVCDMETNEQALAAFYTDFWSGPLPTHDLLLAAAHHDVLYRRSKRKGVSDDDAHPTDPGQPGRAGEAGG